MQKGCKGQEQQGPLYTLRGECSTELMRLSKHGPQICEPHPCH